jgi:carbonic anhydrase
MDHLTHLFNNNRTWSENIRQNNPDFFLNLSEQQRPQYLWIGCSDSRVPANDIVGLMPGELFVHRNVANLVVHTDLNCLSVLQFAIDVLGVRHVIVCGHYGCSGVRAAASRTRIGLADNWLRHVQDVHQKHDMVLKSSPSFNQQCDRLCELNVIEQVANVCDTSVIRDAWERGQKLSVHGWIYGLRDGLLHDLQTTADSNESRQASYEDALTRLIASSP